MLEASLTRRFFENFINKLRNRKEKQRQFQIDEASNLVIIPEPICKIS